MGVTRWQLVWRMNEQVSFRCRVIRATVIERVGESRSGPNERSEKFENEIAWIRVNLVGLVGVWV